MYKELFENLTLIKNFQGFFTKEDMQQAKADPAAIWFFNTQKLEDYIDVRGTEDEFYCVLKNDNVATLQSQFYKTNFNGIAAVGVACTLLVIVVKLDYEVVLRCLRA